MRNSCKRNKRIALRDAMTNNLQDCNHNRTTSIIYPNETDKMEDSHRNKFACISCTDRETVMESIANYYEVCVKWHTVRAHLPSYGSCGENDSKNNCQNLLTISFRLAALDIGCVYLWYAVTSRACHKRTLSRIQIDCIGYFPNIQANLFKVRINSLMNRMLVTSSYSAFSQRVQ